MGPCGGSVCLPFRSYDFSVSKDPHGFLVGDANERAIRAFSLALTAPSIATAETIKVPMTAEQWQPKMPRPRLSSLGETAFRKG